MEAGGCRPLILWQAGGQHQAPKEAERCPHGSSICCEGAEHVSSWIDEHWVQDPG